MNNSQIVDLTHRNLVDIYGCLPIALVRGNGSYLEDADGNRYLDFFCGLAVTNLGHSHPRVVRAIREQSERLMHVSNIFHTEPTARLAEQLAKRFGDGRVFFGNSGAEANEAAIKLARRWGHKDGGGRFEIIATLGSFHGRTLATLSATGQEKYHQGFQPLVPGFKMAPFDDVEAFGRAIGENTVAVMIEPIQGEGGVVVPKLDYLKRVREFCDRNKLLMILDEIQVGIGRTGKFFAYEHAGVKPDIITLAKALGGGLPLGAMIAKSEIASSLTPGSHGTTFGGNPVSCAAGLATVEAIEEEKVLENATRMGAHIIGRLREVAKTCDRIREVRGLGMIIGVVLKHDPKPVVDACLKEKLLVNGTAGNVLRMLPPLNLSREDADKGLAIIERALRTAPMPA
ncbi:MAG TPA: acetylornithine transaminase [Candidatus Binataceae bacterium]|nr:acetylornithine transaminase [Candidatus Binataceae bacterium]